MWICTSHRLGLPFERTGVSQEIPITKESQGREGSPPVIHLDSALTATIGRGVTDMILNTPATGVRENTQCPSVEKKRTNRSRSPPRVSVKNTTVKAEVLAKYLVGYDEDKASYLIDSFSHGFHIE